MWIKKAITTALVGGAVGGGISGASHGQPAPTAFTEAATATSALRSLTADYDYTVTITGRPAGMGQQAAARGQGKLSLQRPNLARVENGNLSVSDGSHSWFWAAGPNQYEEKPIAPDGRDLDTNVDPVPLISFFFDPSLNGLHAFENGREYDSRTGHFVTGPFPAKARLLGEEDWRGLHCQVVEVSRETPYHNTLKVYLGPDHLVHRIVSRRADGNAVETRDLAVTRLSPNAALPASTFTFTPPPGSTPFPPKR